MKTKKMFPLFVDLSEKQVTVIGGGHIAERRVMTLTNFTENIKVISPKITPTLQKLYEEKKINWVKKEFSPNDIIGADMVLAITDNSDVNSMIYEECRKNNILISNAGDVNQCEFHFPGVICHDDIVIGFNGGGYNHRKTRLTREKVEEFLKNEDK